MEYRLPWRLRLRVAGLWLRSKLCLGLVLAAGNRFLPLYVVQTVRFQGFGEQGIWPEGVKGKSGLVSVLCCSGLARLGRAG